MNHFNSLFREKKLTDYHYGNYPLQNLKELAPLLDKLENPRGFNITSPYKQEIIPYLEDTDKDAMDVGAVNTILVHKNGISGYNTDIIGFRESFLPLLKPWHQRAMVLGTGGAAAAVCHVLKNESIEFDLISRDPNKGVRYEEIDAEFVSAHPIIIHCTPSGMYPSVENMVPIPLHSISSRHLVYDLVYDPAETSLMNACRKRGATVKNGLEMLYIQASESWKIWEKSS